jgi:hypothetical protein
VKKNLLPSSILLGAFFLAAGIGCKKGIKDPITLDKAAGKWSINAIRYKIYTGSPEAKDSTVPWRPVTENQVTFDGVSRLQYQFNSADAQSGEYGFIGADSITLNISSKPTRWKILLLTPTNFNIERTELDNPSFPGATVVTYQGFVR